MSPGTLEGSDFDRHLFYSAEWRQSMWRLLRQTQPWGAFKLLG